MSLKLATKFEPLPDKMEAASRAGFRFAELWLDQKILPDVPRVIEQARQSSIAYAIHFPNRLDLASSDLEQTVALYRGLECRSLVIHQPMFDKFHESLQQLDPNIRFAVENHRLTPARFEIWADVNPGLTLDIEHLWKFTLENCPLQTLLEYLKYFLSQFGNKLRHVHLPGYWPGFIEHRPMYCAREMIFPVLSILADAHFEGFIVSEIELEYQNIHEMRMDVLLFEAWREKAEREQSALRH